jgi:hypothetical protein
VAGAEVLAAEVLAVGEAALEDVAGAGAAAVEATTKLRERVTIFRSPRRFQICSTTLTSIALAVF